VTISVPGNISTLIRKYPDHLPVKHDTKELQKTTTKGTEHILLKVRMLHYKTFIIRKKKLHGPHFITTEQLQ